MYARANMGHPSRTMGRDWKMKIRQLPPSLKFGLLLGCLVFVFVPMLQEFCCDYAADLVVRFQRGEVAGGTGQVFEEAFYRRGSWWGHGEVACGAQDKQA